jgi:hypothetical protein
LLRTFTNGAIEYFFDRDRRIVFACWNGDIRGDELLSDSPDLWRQYPDVLRFNAIHDMLDYTGVIEHRFGRELMRLRAELLKNPQADVRTAIVSADPMKATEIKVTKLNAPERQFRVFASNAAALDWVTADEPGNQSAGLRDRGDALPWWFDRKRTARKSANSR